jgi:Flp pilus assembly protein CpaB
MSVPNKKPRRTIVVPVLILLLGLAVAGWAREATKSPELIEIVVAKKDLSSSAAFTEKSLGELTMTKWIPKSELPKDCITSSQELVGKRLLRSTYEGECFRTKDLSDGCTIRCYDTILEHYKDTYTVQVPWPGTIAAGSRVDVVGAVVEGKRHHAITFLPDMLVIAVNPTKPQPGAPGPIAVSLSVTEDEVKLLLLARSRGVKPELVLRPLDAPLRYSTPEQRDKARHQTIDFLVNLGVEMEPVE